MPTNDVAEATQVCKCVILVKWNYVS